MKLNAYTPTVNPKYYKKYLNKPQKVVSRRKKRINMSRRLHKDDRYNKYIIPPKLLNLYMRGGSIALMDHITPSGARYGTIMQTLGKLWIGYKVAKRLVDMDNMKYYAKAVQTVAADLGLLTPSFPTLGNEFLGDHYFMFEKPIAEWRPSRIAPGADELNEFSESVITTDYIPHKNDEDIEEIKERPGELDIENREEEIPEERELVVLTDENEEGMGNYFSAKLNQRR